MKGGWEDLEGVWEGERHNQDILSEKNVINKKNGSAWGKERQILPRIKRLLEAL